MTTLVATRYNPLIQAQYQLLLKRGKLKQGLSLPVCEICLTILHAVLSDQQPFRAPSVA